MSYNTKFSNAKLKEMISKVIINVLASIEDKLNTSELDVTNGSELFEVPDDFLLSLHQLRSNATLVRSLLSRQNQESGNGTQETSTSNRRCVCDKGVCKCCTGAVLDLFNQKACMRVTYRPGDFAFDVAMSLNNRILYENSMSGKPTVLFIF